jgi:hypothetical protein
VMSTFHTPFDREKLGHLDDNICLPASILFNIQC